MSRKLWGNENVRGTEGTGENEWYTPADIIHDARAVMGVIDLDPASSEQAQHTVQALQYLTLADDGLMRMWHGNVWLNPKRAKAKPLVMRQCRAMGWNVADGVAARASTLGCVGAVAGCMSGPER